MSVAQLNPVSDTRDEHLINQEELQKQAREG